MQTTFQLDHVVILVNDLAAAIEDYAALGFTVTPGGEHERLQTHNALIAFADDSYLELIAFKGRPIPPTLKRPKQVSAQQVSAAKRSLVECRILPWGDAGEGLVDFALLPPAIEQAIDMARQRGLTLDGPLPGHRLRPDSRLVSWQFGFPDGFDLPFLCADVTPRSLRVPAGAARQHANGATGIVNIVVAVADLDTSLTRYRALLDVEPQQGLSFPLPEARTVDFALSSTIITLATPAGRRSALNDELTARGEGPYALRLRTSDATRAGELDPTRTHGARLELSAQSDRF